MFSHVKLKRKKKILLYETDRQVGLLLKDLLLFKGYEVDLVHSIESGYAQFTSNRYDLCIVEFNEEKKRGFNLGINIRLMDATVPILFLLPRFLNFNQLNDQNDEFGEYLQKPFKAEELLLSLDSLLVKTKSK